RDSHGGAEDRSPCHRSNRFPGARPLQHPLDVLRREAGGHAGRPQPGGVSCARAAAGSEARADKGTARRARRRPRGAAMTPLLSILAKLTVITGLALIASSLAHRR